MAKTHEKQGEKWCWRDKSQQPAPDNWLMAVGCEKSHRMAQRERSRFGKNRGGRPAKYAGTRSQQGTGVARPSVPLLLALARAADCQARRFRKSGGNQFFRAPVRCWVLASKFASLGAPVKLGDCRLRDVIATCDVDRFQPTALLPPPARNGRDADPLQESVKCNRCSFRFRSFDATILPLLGLFGSGAFTRPSPQ